MALAEKLWEAVSQALLVNGDATGVVTVASTAGFYSGQLVEVSGTALATLQLKVLEVLSATQMRLGAVAQSYEGSGTSLASYTVAASAVVVAKRQPKTFIGNDEVIASVYEAQPVTALRVFPTGPDASFQFLKASNSSVTAGNASVTQAFTVGTLTSDAKILSCFNSLNQPVGVSLNGRQIMELESSERITYDLAANGSQINASTTIGVWNISATSTSGSIRFSVVG